MLSQEFLMWFLNWAVTVFLIYIVLSTAYLVFIVVVVSYGNFVEWMQMKRRVRERRKANTIPD